MIHLILVCGKAGSGKDTFGNRLAEKLDGVTLGLADPMKRMMAELFGFNDTQLYGPSEERNKIDPRLDWNFINREVRPKLLGLGPKWIRQLAMDAHPDTAAEGLYDWFSDCQNRSKKDFGLSARYVLQTFGTEWGRTQDPEVWSKKAVKTARILLGGEHVYDRRVGLHRVPTMKRPPNLAVITDGRFSNEIVNVKSAAGVAVEIRRPSATDTATTGVNNHVSEAGLDEVPPHFYDGRLLNDGTLEDLLAAADRFGNIFTRPKTLIATQNAGRVMPGVA